MNRIRSILVFLVAAYPLTAQDVLIESLSSEDVVLKVLNNTEEAKELGIDIAGPFVTGLKIDIPSDGSYTNRYGLHVEVQDGTAPRQMALVSIARGNDYKEAFGTYGDAHGGDGSVIFGVYGVATADINGGDGAYAYGVYGTATANGSVAFRAAGYFNGPIWATSALQISDEKFKKNIHDLQGGLQKVMALKPRVYEMRVEEFKDKVVLPTGEQIGFIAQELEKVLPQLVSRGVSPSKVTLEKQEGGVKPELTEFKGVEYSGIIPVLVKAMQEQQAMTESLNAEVAALKAR